LKREIDGLEKPLIRRFENDEAFRAVPKAAHRGRRVSFPSDIRVGRIG
jgi:hypothetical protein